MKLITAMFAAALLQVSALFAQELGREPTELLAGRLMARFPEGAKIEARRKSIMAAHESAEKETRVVWDAGNHHFVMTVNETFSLAGEDLEAKLKKYVEKWGSEYAVESLTLPCGLEAWIVAPSKLNLEAKAIYVMGSFLVLKDRSVVQTAMYVNAAGAADGESNRKLAASIVRSITSGRRALERAAGERIVARSDARHMKLRVPADFVSISSTSHDFAVVSYIRLVSFGEAPGPSINIYLGAHPNWVHEQAGVRDVESSSRALIGKDVEWKLWTHEDGVRYREAMVESPLDDRILHLFLTARTDEDMKVIEDAAGTLELTSK